MYDKVCERGEGPKTNEKRKREPEKSEGLGEKEREEGRETRIEVQRENQGLICITH